MSAIPAATATTNWVPSRKWFSGLAVGILTIGAHALASQGWGTTEWGELLALATAMATAYGVSNG
jgi:hypothetical protein